MEHPSIIGRYLESVRAPTVPDTVMALPLINQPASDSIKELGGRGPATAISSFYFPKSPARGALYLSGASARYRGLAREASSASDGQASTPNSLPSPRLLPSHLVSSRLVSSRLVSSRSAMVRASPHARNYRGRYPAITVMPRPSCTPGQLPGPLIISDEITPGRPRNDNAGGGGRSRIVLLK